MDGGDGSSYGEVLSKIRYNPPIHNRHTNHTKSKTFYGLDTEAYTDGRPFMVCTSEGDIWRPETWLENLFTRKYRGASFVCWNLRYDMSALLSVLPHGLLSTLRDKGECYYGQSRLSVLGWKCLTIRRGKNSVHIYDLMGFYGSSLENAARTYLGMGKSPIDVKQFTPEWVAENWGEIGKYCVRDAMLTYELGLKLIAHFEHFGVYPQKLYSTAHVSWSYFRTKCPYVHIKREWKENKELIRYAMASYNGGKFEVIRKGRGYYYEYDIVSAYPSEIADLVDTRSMDVVVDRRYRKSASYSFLEVSFRLPMSTFSPVAVKSKDVCRYPVGLIRKVVTKREYEYLTAQGADITIHKAWHMMCDKPSYPYREEIHKLMEFKNQYKREGDKLRYHTVKIFLNSLYGKMAQLIEDKGEYKAGAAWHPIYASVITANCRVRVTEMQQRFPEIVAVHTDSVISTKPLPIKTGSALGEWEKSVEGEGIILGSGVYQIGTKSKFRGFDTKKPLLDLIPSKGKHLRSDRFAPLSWRVVVQRGLPNEMINRFVDQPRKLSVAFDTKRLWLDDWTDFSEVNKRNVESLPLVLLDKKESAFPF